MENIVLRNNEKQREIISKIILLLEDNHSKFLRIKTYQTFIKIIKENIIEIDSLKMKKEYIDISYNFNYTFFVEYTFHSNNETHNSDFIFFFKSNNSEFLFSDESIYEFKESLKKNYFKLKDIFLFIEEKNKNKDTSFYDKWNPII